MVFPSQPVKSTRKLTLSTYLHCPGSSRGAGPDLEQPRVCRCRLASFPGGSTLVNNQGLSTKHAHQMRRLFSLHYSFLEKKKLAVSFTLLLKGSTSYARNGLYDQLYGWNLHKIWSLSLELSCYSYYLPHKNRLVLKQSALNRHFILIDE